MVERKADFLLEKNPMSENEAFRRITVGSCDFRSESLAI